MCSYWVDKQKQQLEEEVNELKKTVEERDTALLKVKNDLQSAYNQMASDKEVKYYLDESVTRVSQEAKWEWENREKEEMMKEMKKEFATAMRQKEALLAVNVYEL